jgi:ABC-type branched-subunit amino acid transport system ATPase component
MALLEVEQVSVRFGGVQALDEVSLRLNRGEILGLIGPNGAGKTTLFNCLSGVQRPSSGRVRFEGRSIDTLKPNRRARLGLARTFQNLQLFADLTVLENLMVPVDAFSPRGLVADGLRLPRARIEERRADERGRAVLHFLGIGALAATPAGGLPVGLQRRVELGRALCSRPKLLLLDEPAAGLDAAETAELASLLSRIRDRFSTSMLLVDHDMALVMRACEHLYVLDYGRLIASGPPSVIRDDARVVQAYLGKGAA